MALVGTPIAPVEVPGLSYQTLAEANARAANIFGLSAWLTADDSGKAKALAEACRRIDAARAFQGRKLCPDQALQFPRIDGHRLIDADSNRNPIVPENILVAQILEADAILAGDKHTRRVADRQGLASQSNAEVSETYVAAGAVGGGSGVTLCNRAAELVWAYRIRSGAIL